MLQKMREKTQGIIAIIISVIIGLTFVLWGIQYYLESHSGANALAKVNSEKITEMQFDNSYERAKRGLMIRFGKDFVINQQMQAKLKASVLQQLINSNAFFQEATNAGFTVSPVQISAILQHLPAFQENGQFSGERFQEMLSNMLYSEGDFLKEVQQNVVTNDINRGILWSSFVTKTELDNLIKALKQTRDINYILITKDDFAKTITISDQDVKTYYDSNADEFKLPEQLSLAYVILNADDLKGKIHITDTEVHQYYNDHIDRYSTPKSWEISRILIPLPTNASKGQQEQASTAVKNLITKAANDADFSKVDPKAGKPVTLTKEQMPEDFFAQIETAPKNEIVGPFYAANGIWAVKILTVKEAQTEAFDKVKDKVAKALEQDKLAQLFSDESNKLADLTYTNSNSLEPAAKELGLTVKTTDFFTKDSVKTGILTNPKVQKAAFSDTVSKQNYNSDVIDLGSGQVMVLRINQKKAEQTKPLSEVENSIHDKLFTEKAKQQTETVGAALTQEIGKGKLISDAAKEHNFKYLTEEKVARNNATLDKQIIAAAFDLPITQDKTVPNVAGVKLENGDYAIIEVTKAYDGELNSLNNNQLNGLKNQMALAIGNIEFSFYMKSLIDKAKIKQYPQE